jgi:hypothetical protein
MESIGEYSHLTRSELALALHPVQLREHNPHGWVQRYLRAGKWAPNRDDWSTEQFVQHRRRGHRYHWVQMNVQSFALPLSNFEQSAHINRLILIQSPSPGEAGQSMVWEAILIRTKTGVLLSRN